MLWCINTTCATLSQKMIIQQVQNKSDFECFLYSLWKKSLLSQFFWMIYRLLFHRLRVVSLFFRFSKGSARARGRWAAKPRETRAAARLAPSATRVVICVSRAFCSTDQEKRETTFFKFQSMSILAVRINRREKTVAVTKIVINNKTGPLLAFCPRRVPAQRPEPEEAP